ncbi:uncharacterized protein LOC116131479 [Pistacia vera]|uniref:uncharacterized protein LOC116131479 n=1 Tax=Pistacia vera TaxID=55513 RepID=UPI001262B4B1|nr:uncharacterized protein LOC116131479 [Pistacia vera]
MRIVNVFMSSRGCFGCGLVFVVGRLGVWVLGFCFSICLGWQWGVLLLSFSGRSGFLIRAAALGGSEGFAGECSSGIRSRQALPCLLFRFGYVACKGGTVKSGCCYRERGRWHLAVAC